MAGTDITLYSKYDALPAKVLADVEFQRLYRAGIGVIKIDVVNKVMKFACSCAAGCQFSCIKGVGVRRAASEKQLRGSAINGWRRDILLHPKASCWTSAI